MVRTHRSGESPDSTIVVEVLGPLEAATVGALRSVVLDTVQMYEPRTLIVDLRRVPFMDSIGIGTLVAINNKTREHGGTMQVRSPSPFVHRLLQVTGLTELFGLPDLPEDAPVSGAGVISLPERR
ncbi:STAS domain-containing protein [Dactylosporangium sp. AC04546]|uniref:STAS domain-containing protein n=1 Tax=Dactylosporangium sp. AC04546 TaxID=2862460 RepID=UPI001EDEA1A2|nr:STAS domain-containing protein [Dactylosporangium sp. AC04546]WVK85861.1 STAS domain-containing protein [Dactylosporangium sp. AC04546]